MNSLIKRINQLRIASKINVRQLKTNAELIESCENVENRNPRNLELLRIARKPAGYHLEKPGREFWHKLILTKSQRYVNVEIIHCENKTVLTVSTQEWAIKKQLYSLRDRTAYLNLGRVIAQRCLESGITHVRCDLNPEECEKVKLLLEEIEKGGVILQEPSRYKHAAPWDQYRQEKPWEVEE